MLRFTVGGSVSRILISHFRTVPENVQFEISNCVMNAADFIDRSTNVQTADTERRRVRSWI